MKSLLKPLCVMALLVCKLAQAAVMPMPAQLNPCPQHSMQQLHSGGETMPHATCCKFAGCECLQAPALAGPGLSACVFVGATHSTAVLPSGLALNLAANFFRPPIAQ